MSGDPDSAGGGGGTPKSLESMTPPSAAAAVAAAAAAAAGGLPLSEAKLMSLEDADRRALACHRINVHAWFNSRCYS